MPGTIALMCGKNLLEVRTYTQNKEIRKIFEELHSVLKQTHIPANGFWKNGKPKTTTPLFHFIISTQETNQITNKNQEK